MTVKVTFVCLGNICRSPMADGVFQAMVNEAGLQDQILVDSAGTSSYHVGDPAHQGTRNELKKHGIVYNGRSRQINHADNNPQHLPHRHGREQPERSQPRFRPAKKNLPLARLRHKNQRERRARPLLRRRIRLRLQFGRRWLCWVAGVYPARRRNYRRTSCDRPIHPIPPFKTK